jgi:hypothetical protein
MIELKRQIPRLFFLIVIGACVGTGVFYNASTDYAVKNFKIFECDYLGQELPGDIPVRFAQGIVSTDDDDSCFEISVSGKEIVFTREMRIYIIKQDQNGVWSSPSPLPFSGGETSFSKDGKKIYFNSRDHFPGAKVPLNVWVTQKLNNRWDKPFPLGEPVTSQTVHAPTVAANGNMYASGIIRLKFIDGEYQPPEKLMPAIKGSHPFISADESFMIFDRRPSTGGNPADLFFTFRNPDDTWTDPVRLGEEINTSALETNAFVTPDGKYMFFTRKFDVYWVKADFIGKIRNQSITEVQSISKSKCFIPTVFSLYFFAVPCGFDSHFLEIAKSIHDM